MIITKGNDTITDQGPSFESLLPGQGIYLGIWWEYHDDGSICWALNVNTYETDAGPNGWIEDNVRRTGETEITRYDNLDEAMVALMVRVMKKDLQG